MDTLKLVFDRILFYKMIGTHPEHMRLRKRVEQRLAALKQKGTLYESAAEQLPATASSAYTGSKATGPANGTSAEYSLVNNWRASNR